MKLTASAYIVFENKVLLVKHKKSDCWLPPGGHLEKGESLVDGCIREVKEETGLDIALVPFQENFENDISLPFSILHKKNKHVTSFIATATTNVVNLQEEELTNYMWLTKEELLAHEDIIEPVKQKALFALDFVHSSH